MSERTLQDLQMKQALPLSLKISLTKARIRQWINEYSESGVYVSFSGGKDSTVLLDLVRQDYPNVEAVFVDTGLEYPEIREFVKTFDNVTWLKPKMNFRQVIERYGYPFISKEVSESVEGARKYLTQILEEMSLDRQTDRQTDDTLITLENSQEQGSMPNFQKPLMQTSLNKHTSTALGGGTDTTISTKQSEYLASQALRNPSRGGYDNKYRKVCGLGEYSKRENAETVRRGESEVSNDDGMANERPEEPRSGEYP